MTWSPTTPLEQAVHAGDHAATLALLRAQTPAERLGQRASVTRLCKLADESRYRRNIDDWGGEATLDQLRAAAIAGVLCGTARLVSELWIDAELLVALGHEFHPPSLDGLADELLARSPLRIRTVQALIAAGLAARPDTDAYTLGLMALPRVLRRGDSFEQLFAADPGLRAALLRVFDIEGTVEVTLTALDKYNHDPASRWDHVLLALVDDGVATRADLIDRTLGALEKDWPHFRAGWFARFHGLLAPTTAEMQARQARYFGLCLSRSGPTVMLALDALLGMDARQAMDEPALMEALRPVMASSTKGQLEAALKLMDRAVARSPDIAGTAAEIAAMGLLHPAAPVQAAVIKRLEAWGVPDALRARLAEFVDGVASTNRARLVALSGEAAAAPATVAAPRASPPAAGPLGLLDASRRLAPIADDHELVDVIAHVFEHATDVDAFERAVAALVVGAPFIESRPLFAPVLKRATRLRKLLPRELARLLLAVVAGEKSAGEVGRDHAGQPSGAERQLVARIDGLVAAAQAGLRLEPLASATHRGGVIDPARLVERVAAHQAAGASITQDEAVRALLRLAPGAPASVLAQARALADDPVARALRYALGDDLPAGDEPALLAAAARIRHPGADDLALDARHPGLGPDAARVARHGWHVETRSHEAGGQVYTHHWFRSDLADAPVAIAPGLLAVQRHGVLRVDEDWWRVWNFAGIDEGAIRYAATLLPSDLQTFFAEGSAVMGCNLDWSEAEWQNRAFLEPLLDATTPVTGTAVLLLALGLVGKEPGQAALAVDALVQGRQDGRLSSADFAATLRSLFLTPLRKASRLHKSLQAALRLDPLCGDLVFDGLCAVLQARPEDPPRDVGALMGLLLELKVAGGRRLSEDTRAALGAMTGGGSVKTLRRQLLEA